MLFNTILRNQFRLKWTSYTSEHGDLTYAQMPSFICVNTAKNVKIWSQTTVPCMLHLLWRFCNKLVMTMIAWRVYLFYNATFHTSVKVSRCNIRTGGGGGRGGERADVLCNRRRGTAQKRMSGGQQGTGPVFAHHFSKCFPGNVRNLLLCLE